MIHFNTLCIFEMVLYLTFYQIEDDATVEKVRFTSNLFGSLGTGLFVGPNTIDFGTVFLDFDKKILENAAVFFTVTGVIVLYIPLLVVCIKLDKLDIIKVINLELNYFKSLHTFGYIECSQWLSRQGDGLPLG